MISFTPDAAKEIKSIMVRAGLNPEDIATRLAVKGGGCAGMTYVVEFDDQKRKFDLLFESQDMAILVDKKSYIFVKGTTIGWSRELATHGLTFDNPKATVSCSCRTSFIIEMPEQENVFKPTW